MRTLPDGILICISLTQLQLCIFVLQLFYTIADLTKQEDVLRLVKEGVEEYYGRLDILVSYLTSYKQIKVANFTCANP